MVDLRQFKAEWLKSIGKAASALRFECGQQDWHTPAAREELGRIADTLAEIEQAAIHPAEPAHADGWVRYASGHVKDFGNVTACVGEYAGGIACCHFLPPDVPRDSIAWAISPDAPRNAPLLMEWLDAAYAAHLDEQAKPVLAWESKYHGYRTATKGDLLYMAHMTGPSHWVASIYGPESWALIGIGIPSEEEAKAACERHARGE